jgi:hypothetical protein
MEIQRYKKEQKTLRILDKREESNDFVDKKNHLISVI